MPFPLAHPAAVLPFRRYCPRFLSLTALMVGSLSPDVGYFFSKYEMDDFSHRLSGVIGFCLPVGMVTLLMLHGVGSRMVKALPHPFRRICARVCQQPLGSPWAVVISVLIGAGTHLLWDSFTHKDGWLVEHLPVLQSPVALIGNRTLRLCHLLWYGSTFAGVTWLAMAFQRWLQVTSPSATPTSRRAQLGNALGFAVLVQPLSAAHHLFHSLVGDYLVAVLSVVLVAGFAFWAGGASQAEA